MARADNEKLCSLWPDDSSPMTRVSSRAQSASSLHQTAGARQEVLHVSDRRLGQVGHGAEAATGGTVVEKVADPGRWVLLEEIITGTVGFLGKQRTNRVNPGQHT